MDVTRRGWLGLASAAGAAALARPLQAAGKSNVTLISPGTPAHDYGPALERIQSFAAAEIAQLGFPGMTLALVGPGGFAATQAVGYADVERRLPVRPGHLFQIGSISKSLVALALFVLAERGKVDLEARVQDLLPDHPLPSEPITLTQLLDHSSGLPGAGISPFPPVPGRRLWTGWVPGTRFSYCNLGYVLLGAILERASGMTCARTVEALVLQPLAMTRSLRVIRAADRARYATGYIRFRDDVPWLPRAPLAPAQWVDFDEPPGSVAAPSSDMTRYLAYLAALGRGQGGPLLSKAAARRFLTPTVDTPHYGPGARYGNGIISLGVEGRPCLRHTGGMLAFSSAFTVDTVAGVACYANVNVGGAGGYRPIEMTEYAVANLRAAAEGKPLPEVRRPAGLPPVKDPARLVGRWLSADGPDIVIAERGGELFVTAAGLERRLYAASDVAFASDHPSLEPYVFRYQEGTPQTLRLGDRLYGRGTAPIMPPPTPRLAQLAGVYYNPASWEPRIAIRAVEDKLMLGAAPLVEHADGSWRYAAPERANERIWFENFVDGRPQQVNYSGGLFERVHDQRL
jgi:CubicO group peptidase (beta-lactamase class C family)